VNATIKIGLLGCENYLPCCVVASLIYIKRTELSCCLLCPRIRSRIIHRLVADCDFLITREADVVVSIDTLRIRVDPKAF
jgi:hypothetical protein